MKTLVRFSGFLFIFLSLHIMVFGQDASTWYPVMKGGKYGFIDESGKVMIAFQFSYASGFQEGMAMVSDGEKYGYIDATGKKVVACQYDVASAFNNGLARVGNQTPKGAYSGKLYGYINKTGKLVIPMQYDDAGDFSDGLAPVAIYKSEGYKAWGDVGFANPRYGYINTEGKEVIPFTYSYAQPFRNGVAVAKFQTSESYSDVTTNYIVTTGDEVSEEFYLKAITPKGDLLAKSENGKYGFVNPEGNWVINPTFDYAQDFSEGIGVVAKAVEDPDSYDGTSYLYAYIGATGKLLTGYDFTVAHPFSEGLAKVAKANNKIYIINKTGQTVLEFKEAYLPDNYVRDNAFRNGILPVQTSYQKGEDYFYKTSYINKQGKIIFTEDAPIQHCFPAHTRILMADGSEKAIAEVRVGDLVMGLDGKPAPVTWVQKYANQQALVVLTLLPHSALTANTSNALFTIKLTASEAHPVLTTMGKVTMGRMAQGHTLFYYDLGNRTECTVLSVTHIAHTGWLYNIRTASGGYVADGVEVWWK